MNNKSSAKNIKLVVLDVDGVLTDGTINISEQGELFKKFYVRDGLGIKLLQDAGIAVAICTGRTSGIVTQRAKELSIDWVLQGQLDKRQGFSHICAMAYCKPEQVAYMGDDYPDLCLFPMVGLSCAPADAIKVVREKADWVSTQPAGHGAVRELAEFILKAQKKLDYSVKKRFGIEI